MECHVCKQLTEDGNDAVNYSYDNFHRFYARFWILGEEDISGHSYRHRELKDAGHTRLLELLPGTGSEPIACTLAEVPIDDMPRYSALSYTWGTTARNRKVLVNDKNFLVTDNLWAALWHLRHPVSRMIVWVDAICIDQSNIEERNHVVLRMKDIYERAEEIIAWLGPEGDNGTLAFSCMRRVFDHYTRILDFLGSDEATIQNMLSQKSWAGRREKGDPLILRKNPAQTSPRAAWMAFGRLLQKRTWFHRVWIVQEGTVPIRTTLYLCRERLPVDALYITFRLLESIPPNKFPGSVVDSMELSHIKAFATFAQRRSDRKRLGKRSVFPLVDILAMLRHHLASDPHDKVYSALGFAKTLTRPIEIDYRKPFSVMLRDVAVSCLHETAYNLRFLGYAGLLGSGHMPATWIPDWLYPNSYAAFPKTAYHLGSEDRKTLFDACAVNHQIWEQAEYAALCPSVEGDTLRLQGILVDYVRSVSVMPGSPSNIDSIENVWWLANMHDMYEHTGETLEEAYLRTLVADLKVKDGKVVGRGGSMYWRNRPDSLPPDHGDVQKLLGEICTYRHFISTLRHRYIGLAPLFTKPGDAVFMLRGGEMLYVARPTLDGTYHFVGEAYVHGLMDGQTTQNFSRGKGTMQSVEFVGVLNTVLDSSKPTSTITGKPVDLNFSDRGYGIKGVEYFNPYEDLSPYPHTDTGLSMDTIIAKVVEEDSTACQQNGMPPELIIKRILIDHTWADSIERSLLSDDRAPTGSTSSFQPAGRSFARNSYIRAAIALEKGRMHTQLMSGFRSNAPGPGGISQVLDCDILEDEEGPSNAESEDAQIAEDEKIARQMQEEEFAAANTASHPHNVQGTGKNAVSDNSGPTRHPFPLFNRRTGPPVRLMMSDTFNPCTVSYKFEDKEDEKQFIEDCKGYPFSGGDKKTGLKRVLLFGPWATNPRRRPKVELHSYGNPPDIWWEDEEGNVVEGPDINTSPGDVKPAGVDSTWNRAVGFGGWDGEDEAEIPVPFWLTD